MAEGYTMYIDGWGNYFFNDNFFKAAQQMDQEGKMNFVLGLTYEIESWMNVDEELKKAVDVQKYATTHVKTNWLKLFMDGTVEGGTGFVDPLYPDGHQGLANWTEEELTDITRKTNAKGLSMHIHTMGNKAVNYVVSAYRLRYALAPLPLIRCRLYPRARTGARRAGSQVISDEVLFRQRHPYDLPLRLPCNEWQS